MIIVIGGSSYIGKNICEHFSKEDKPFIGTYYNSLQKNLHYFDLQNPDLRNLNVDLRKVSHAVICSAITNIDTCKREETKTYKINVDGTKKVLEQLFEHRIFPLFFSSDYVFNGERGNYTENDETNPCTVYGRYKKTIEDFLLKSKNEFLIARISKIFGLVPKDGTILTTWKEQLLEDKNIQAAYDQIFSFTYIQDLVGVLNSAIEKRLTGIYNVASPESFSRLDLAKMLKSRLKIESGKIIPCSIDDFNFLDSRPKNTSLDTKKIQADTGFKFSRIEDCIDKLK